MPQRPARSLLFGLVLVAGLPFAGENAGAAQVGIAVGPFVSDIRVWDIVTAPPMPPAPPRQVHNDVVLPGNVAHFRLGVRAPGEPFPRLYAIDCDVRPGRRSIVMVMAGRVSMDPLMPYDMLGSFVGQMGDCHVTRLDRERR